MANEKSVPDRRAGSRTAQDDRPPGHQGVYPISIVSELTGVEPHLLRAWEKAGLLSPVRSVGGTRRYSADDLIRLRHIRALASEGLNVPGIRTVLQLEEELALLRAELDELRAGDRSSSQ
ncbi:MerR family transcriptional regulator [Actinopolymorpha pittospori]|uniref:DNA-binding transcriptional MerR regulator n=1 Tax=Actinopolymorpha pittospori TaxID=648752 RepID=A0A927MWR8_9ACTN|nr:MerR family transcriptional regulator [Actinopolymorpha pittospori]MBE1604660.1 DNA-binding transcriptional MerR regulator [Actinopolymorpha pittospori]